MSSIKPGTYRITSVWANTCIGVRDECTWDAVCFHRRDRKDQQWYVQRSGGGYRIQSCLNGTYLAVSNIRDPSDRDERTLWMFCSRYPTTWEIYQEVGRQDEYIIEQADSGRVVDLWHWLEDDGSRLCTFPKGDDGANQRWKFERLSDDTGEREIKIRDQIISLNKTQIVIKDLELAQLREQLSIQQSPRKRAISEPTNLPEAQRQAENQNITSLLVAIQKTNERQENEIRKLRERLDRFEQSG
ncbi:ricin-type beta-trefoil lectin domain protein [Ceratobasidium sp. AG-Ba]|nr:ricin-type beta-trefoil lectin domain protein [Ceratobasidium sp. AG-Ba]